MLRDITQDDIPSYQKELANTPGPPPPDSFREVSRRTFGLEDIPIERYTSREFLQLEYQQLWPRVWQFACREEDIPEVGDYVVYDIGEQSVILVRSSDGRVRAFHNSCLHRGTQLAEGSGNCEQFRCRFHGWCYDVDGSLTWIASRWDFPQITEDQAHLPEARVDTWAGFVFINFDPEAEPLETALDVIPDHFRGLPLKESFTFARFSKVAPTNWKAAVEAFLENYHAFATHPQTLEFAADLGSQYDVWTNVSRSLTALGRASAYLGEDYLPSATYEAAASFMVGPAFPIPELADGVTPREALGSLVADLFQALLQVDLSDVSLPELLDTPQYFMFPNWIIFGTPAFPAMYRFLPNGDDPHSSIFEVRILMPTPAGQKPPPAAPLRVLGPDEPFTAVPELPAPYANIFDQDFSNFPFIQRGMRASANSGLKLAEYDESRIRHFHHLLEQWLSL